MATLLRTDQTYFDAVTPRSIYFVLDKSKAMRKPYCNTNCKMDNFSGGRSFGNSSNFDSGRSLQSAADEEECDILTEERSTSRISFAKDCIKFVINSCLSGNDYISLTTFDQQISKVFVHQSLQDNKDFVLDELDSVVRDEDCSGPCALYDALQHTLLSAYGNKTFSNFDSWIVVFTTGNDTASTRTLDEMDDIMVRINLNFIVVSLDTGKIEAKPNKRNLLRNNTTVVHTSDEDDSGKVDTESHNDASEITFPEGSSSDDNNQGTRRVVTDEEIVEDPDSSTACRKVQFSKKEQKFSTSGHESTQAAQAHPLECLFEPTRKRRCCHLNSRVESNDRIRYQLFSAFEEIDINVFDTIMEEVL